MAKALLVIDMLRDFIEPDGALYCGAQGEAIVSFIKEKIEAFRADGDPVILICDCHAPDDLEFQRFPAHCIAGSDGASLIDALRFDGYEKSIQCKQRFSGFFHTGLDRQLADIDEVHVVGVCTNICVLFTVEELCNRDKQVVVYRAGVASFDSDAHAFALRQMECVLGAQVK